jgi:multiple antibiotic resistance protein
MSSFTSTILLVYAGLFPIVNPIGSAPLFLGLTNNYTLQQRAKLATDIAINSFFLLLGSLFVGSHVLEFFGISLPVVRIGGGLVVTSFGWKLLNSGASVESHTASPDPDTATPDSFYPLTMPLTVGPGSISVAITLGSQRPRVIDFAHLVVLGGAAVTGILAITISIYVSYRFAGRIVSMLGHGGTNVVVRLSAFILLCIGIQIIWSGWTELVTPPK